MIARATTRLSEDAPLYLDDRDDAESAVNLLRQVRELRQQLASVEAFCEAETAKRLGNGKHNVPGFQVEVRGGSRYTEWRHDELAFALCRPIAVDPATGEIVPEVVQIIDQVRTTLLNAARPDWRTTVLRANNINPGDYSTRVQARRTVTITPDADA
jgi:hypothetical protein